jgi:hypothetical protein
MILIFIAMTERLKYDCKVKIVLKISFSVSLRNWFKSFVNHSSFYAMERAFFLYWGNFHATFLWKAISLIKTPKSTFPVIHSFRIQYEEKWVKQKNNWLIDFQVIFQLYDYLFIQISCCKIFNNILEFQ